MGYIKDGKYHPGKPPSSMMPMQHQGLKAHLHDRQREDHARDIIQPWNNDGTPNEAFMDEYPGEAQEYGMINNNEEAYNGQTERQSGEDGD